MGNELSQPFAKLAVELREPLVGRTIAGKFAIDSRLGAGAMGIVYRARQVALEKTVAIKVLHRELAADPKFGERFWREARAASRLDHPNSIRVFDFGQEPDGLLYIAMEYVEGRDLFRVMTEHGGPIPTANVISILSQVLAALAVAHDMGVLHRDLKPENIMVVAGRSDEGKVMDLVKVCDFGIAKIADTPSDDSSQPRRKHSTAGIVVGTPAYMSPEQARGEKQDQRSDLYSVGVMLYELLTGRVPFEAETALGVALKHLGERPQPPSARAIGVNVELEAICLKALSKDPAERFESAREMRRALRNVSTPDAAGVQVFARPQGLPSAPPSALVERVQRRADSSKPTLAAFMPTNPVSRTPRARGSRAWGLIVVAIACIAILPRLLSKAPPARPLAEAVLSKVSAPAGANVPPPSSEPLETRSSAPVASPETALDFIRRPNETRPLRAKAETASAPVVGTAARVPTAMAASGVQAASASPSSAPALAAPIFAPTAISSTVALTATAPAVVPSQLLGAPASSAASSPSPSSPSAGPSYDPALARIDIGMATNVTGATAYSVTRAVSDAASQMTACYKAALPRLNGAVEGRAVLHVESDGAGVVTEGRLGGAFAGSMASCLVSAVMGHRVPNVDTGSASADVPLLFRVR